MSSYYRTLKFLIPSLLRKGCPTWDVRDNHDLVVEWLDDNTYTLSPATWNLYRSALVSHLKTEHPELAENIRAITTERCRKRNDLSKRPRTSAIRRKGISLREEKEIMLELAEARSKYDTPLQLWLRVGIMTGLRPEEWRQTEIVTIKNKDALKVKNAKNTQGRAHGEFRHLYLDQMSDDESKAIRAWVVFVSSICQYNDDENNFLAWEHFQRRCSLRMGVISRRIWPKKRRIPTLYSTRHQFAANAKASDIPLVEIATMLGHSTTQTVISTYGRKVWGNKGACKAYPDQDEIKRVANNIDPRAYHKYINKKEILDQYKHIK